MAGAGKARRGGKATWTLEQRVAVLPGEGPAAASCFANRFSSIGFRIPYLPVPVSAVDSGGVFPRAASRKECGAAGGKHVLLPLGRRLLHRAGLRVGAGQLGFRPGARRDRRSADAEALAGARRRCESRHACRIQVCQFRFRQHQRGRAGAFARPDHVSGDSAAAGHFVLHVPRDFLRGRRLQEKCARRAPALRISRFTSCSSRN